MNGIKEFNKKMAENYVPFLAKAIKIGIFLAVFLPLIVMPSQAYLFQFGKAIIFRILVELLLLIYIPIAVAEPKYRPRWGIIEGSIALLVGILLITSATGIDFAKSFWGTIERMGGFFSFIHYWIFFIIATSVLKNREDWKKLFGASIIAAVISSLYAIGQSIYFAQFIEWLRVANYPIYEIIHRYLSDGLFIITNTVRPSGTIGNAGLFSGYILFNSFFGFYLLLDSKNARQKMLYAAGIIIMTMALLVAGTRGSYVAFLAGFAAILISYLALSPDKKAKLRIAALIIIAIASVALIAQNKEFLLAKNNFTLNRFLSISTENAMVKSRVMSWKSALEGIEEKPLLGWGQENFNVVFNKYYDPKNFTDFNSEVWSDRAHNIFLDTAVAAGLIGLVSFISVFLAIYLLLFKVLQRHKEESIAVLSFILVFPIVYFAHTFLLFDTFPTYLMLFLFFGFASNYFGDIAGIDPMDNGSILAKIKAFLKDLRKKIIPPQIFSNLPLKHYIFSYMLTVLLIASSIYYGNIKPWLFHNAFTAAIASFNENKQDSFENFEKIMKESTYLGRYDAYKYLAEQTVNIYGQKKSAGVNGKEKMKTDLNISISQLNSAIMENLYDSYFYLMLGKVYNTHYDNFHDQAYINKAEFILQAGLVDNPKNQAILYEYAKTLLLKGDYKKTIEVLGKIKDLNPDSQIYHWYFGITYANTRDFLSAKSELEKAISAGYDYKANVMDMISLARIYTELGDYDKAKSVYDEAINKYPDDAQIYESRRLMYEKIGETNLAPKK